jgi:hypothetical protein
MSLPPEPPRRAGEDELAECTVGWMKKRYLIELIERVVRRILAEPQQGA